MGVFPADKAAGKMVWGWVGWCVGQGKDASLTKESFFGIQMCYFFGLIPLAKKFFFSILFFGLEDSYFSLNMGHLKILSWISFCLWNYHYIMRF